MIRLHCPLIPFHREPPLGPGVPPPDPAEPPDPVPMDLPPAPEREHPVYHRSQRLRATGSSWVYGLHRTGPGLVRGPVGTWQPHARGRLSS
nr:hypothetical protein [uncultured Caldimonas sp.]